VNVQAKHRFNASAERVFDAWLDPQKARKFLFANLLGEMVRAEIDPHVGGKFCLVDRRDGEDIEHVGEYLEVVRPVRLVFTFVVPKFSKEQTKVIIDIAARDTGCELTLTHEGVLPEYADRTQGGWTMILGTLAKALAS
jgi:uncharacterized protein YndB with AHSA1/START domain